MGAPLFTTLEALESARRAADRRYLEFLRVPDLSAGLYVLEPGAIDPQQPHAEDEIYVVMRGRCRFRVGTEEQEVQPGTVLSSPRVWSAASSTFESASRPWSSSGQPRGRAASDEPGAQRA